MPTNEFSVGRDVSLVITDPNQGTLNFNIRTGFDAEPMYTELQSKGLDGRNRFAYLPEGHTLSFEFDRQDDSIKAYFAQREADYFNGLVNPNVTILETITEINGTISQYRYTGVAIKLGKAGGYRGDQKVDQRIEARASRVFKVI